MRILVLNATSFVAAGRCCDCADGVLRALNRTADMRVDELPLDSFSSHDTEPDLVVLTSAPTAGMSRVALKLRRKWETTPILACFCSSNATPAGVLRSMSSGIDDFLNCPVCDVDVLPRVKRLLAQRANRVAGAGAERRVGFSLKNLVGESEAFLKVVELIPRLGDVDGTLLISGETGTGKELFARAIHYAGPRRGKPFVPVNCGALPDHLVENELFGHAKGAFTDASGNESGLVGESEGGTLFLDEVEALSAAAQAKLLRFLQDHEYRPLGSAKTRHANVRVIAATNVDLKNEVEHRRYREDLFYRLSILLLGIPPLRDRGEDVSLLSQHFARKYARQLGRAEPRLHSATLDVLEAHPWRGNVRELEAVIQRSVMMARSSALAPGDLLFDSSVDESVVTMGCFQEAKSSAIESFERRYLTRVLIAHRGNISEAARAAGTDRRALQRLMRKHSIDRQTFIA